MTRRFVRAMLMAAVIGVAGLSPRDRPASAVDRLAGIVLMVPAPGTAVVHHGPFAGMPAMTMTFQIAPGVQLRPGDRIRADVDRTSEPWRLTHIDLGGSEIPTVRAPDAPLLQRGDRLPALALVDQRGAHFSLDALAGTPYALTFAYTRCADPTMCPLISAKLRWLQDHLHRPAALIEVSLDPAFDRPPVLARYAQRFGADPARWHLVTGDPRSVLDFAARFGILEHSAGPVAIVHTERLAVVGRTGRIERLFDAATWSVRSVQAALERS